jgi:hypothetical protein
VLALLETHGACCLMGGWTYGSWGGLDITIASLCVEDK